MQVLPLGVAQVAAATEQAGHEVSLLNLCELGPASACKDENSGLQTFGPSDSRTSGLRAAIGSFQPDVIGISVRNIDDQNMQAPRFLLDPVRDVVGACRAASSAPIVVGGAGYSIFPDAALAYLAADFGVAGEGERIFPLLVERLERGEGVRDLPGVHTAGLRSRAIPSTNLDAFPSPGAARWLASAPRDSWVPVQSRRGCPLDCSYCSTASIEGRQVRRRSPHMVAADLARARAAGFSRFYFVDNTFNLPESYALRLCREIARLDLEITWRCIIYPRKVTEELASAMREAGCIEASIGFEAGNQPMLAALNKRFGLDDVRATCARLADQGMARNGFLLLGGPGETNETIDESLAFADSLRLDTLKVTLGIRIYPGTPLHRTALAEGTVAANDDLLRPRFYLARGIDPSRVQPTNDQQPHGHSCRSAHTSRTSSTAPVDEFGCAWNFTVRRSLPRVSDSGSTYSTSKVSVGW